MHDGSLQHSPQLLKIEVLEQRVAILEKKSGNSNAPFGVYQHNQTSPSATWVINHQLGYFPNVRVVDTAGNTVDGQIQDIDNNSLIIRFFLAGYPYAMIGKAYLS